MRRNTHRTYRLIDFISIIVTPESVTELFSYVYVVAITSGLAEVGTRFITTPVC